MANGFCPLLTRMHRITLLTVGRLREAWARAACDAYAERLRGSMDLRVVEIPASKARTASQQQTEESQRLIAQLRAAPGTIVVLDERGKGMSSENFAAFIGAARDRGEPLTFVLGGAYGLTDAVRKSGSIIKLSDMTLPHELCRVVFLEQLYRAHEIGKGSGYHHGTIVSKD